jgi:hypothetical protein
MTTMPHLSFLAKELKNRGCYVHRSSSGDKAFHVWQRLGPWELVLTDYRFFPGTKTRDGKHPGGLASTNSANAGLLINRDE